MRYLVLLANLSEEEDEVLSELSTDGERNQAQSFVGKQSSENNAWKILF